MSEPQGAPDRSHDEAAPSASAGLGNIFEALESGPQAGPRGDDLTHQIEVPRSALGHGGGQLVPVPAKIVHAGERVARVTELDAEPGWIHLQLAKNFPEGAALKLRGRGEPKTGGRAGDLILKVQFNDEARVRLPPIGELAPHGDLELRPLLGGGHLWLWVAAGLTALGVGLALVLA